jgi:uncharacterized protein (DUF1684 family)
VAEFQSEWQAWREAREARLRDPRGWLAITAIHWLAEEPQRFDDVPGAWSGGDREATVTLRAGESLTAGVRRLGAGEHRLGPLDEYGVTVAFGAAVAQVAQREDRVIVRPRHPDSPHLRSYAGTPCYPADPGWVRAGRFAAYAAPDGDAIGEVVFPHDGAEHRLVAWGEDDGSLWILLRDATSQVTTYPAGRQLLVGPSAVDGSVEVDFNRVINLPCAYTEFATCPVAPAANTLPFAVEAGERLPELG